MEMDWRTSSTSYSRPSRSIMALIVKSTPVQACGRARWLEGKCATEARSAREAREKMLATSAGSRLPLLLTVTLLFLGGFLFSGSRAEEGIRIRVQDYTLLHDEEARTTPCEDGVDGVKDSRTPNLSELVAQSDVIFKAFAGHGNDLREIVRNHSRAAGASQHRRPQHHQPRWKMREQTTAVEGVEESSADFVVRLEPGTVYKGGELFQQLQLNSWKHYFILWSNGSVEYSHRRSPSNPDASLDDTMADMFAPDGSKQSPTETSDSDVLTNAGRSIVRVTKDGRRAQNCTAGKQRMGEKLTSLAGKPQQPPADRFDQDEVENGRASGAATPLDLHNLDDFDRDAASRTIKTRTSMASVENAGLEESVPEKDSPRTSEEQIGHTLNEILPVTLIVFGRLVRGSVPGDNSLRVDPYVGLLRWDERLEDALWQGLGWSKWSDYTSCSVGCGGGVQQRFRHCLLAGGARQQPSPASRETRSPRSSTSSTSLPSPVARRQPGSVNEAQPTKEGERTQPVSPHPPPGASIETPMVSVSTKRKPRQRKSNTKPTAGWHGMTESDGDTIQNASPEAEPVASAGFFEPQDTVPAEAGHFEGTWPSCEGHNIEQRSCNTFDCTGTIDLLTALPPLDNHWRNWNEGIDDRINYEINRLEQNFTLMISLRVKQHVAVETEDEPATKQPTATSGTILSVRSKLTTGPSLSINFVSDGHGGLRIIQEKYGLSEMLPVGELALFDGEWHSLALSGRNGGGFVTVYGDCRWINTFLLTKGSIELPQYPTVEIGHGVELRQLTVVPGEKSARQQCHAPAVAIRDVENRQVTSYFEHLNEAY